MKSLTEFIRFRFGAETKEHKILPESPGTSLPFLPDLHPHLEKSLRETNISSLYSHQVEAFQSISQGQDTLIVSRTASGKTLSFLLPILNDYFSSPAPFTVLLLYPTKALTRDQEGTVGKLLRQAGGEGREGLLGTYDGDTPREEREKLSQMGDFLMTNPDMLHSGILPNHNRKWRSFLSRLKYVVVDEVHTYRGTFGSHVSLVLKRLLRVADLHGSYPTFVGLSATIGNPREHVEALFGRPFHVVDKDGSPRPERNFYFINPPLVKNDSGSFYRKGTGSISVSLIRFAAENGIRTICFCRARQQVERLTRAVLNGRPKLKDKVRPYRGGLLPSERRQLEKDLFSGKITTIITTNALELGIDIGDLDFCLLSGFPGTVSSFWQQAGRVGRKGRKAVIVLAAKESPVDQYLMGHPEFIWGAPVEEAWLNPENPYIFLQHLPCAAQEHPLSLEQDVPLFPLQSLSRALPILEEAGQLALYKDCYHYTGPTYPSRGVNLRGMTDYNIEIYCGTEVIGEIDPIGARGELYKDAIYQHLGRKYMSMDLDLEKKLCRVERVEVDYYTEAVWESRVVMEEDEDTRTIHGAVMCFGRVDVHRQPKLFKKIREGSLENIGYGPITLAPFEYKTMGLSLLPPPRWEEILGKVDKRYTQAGLSGLSYLIKKLSPSLCMADRSDVDTDLSLGEKAALTFRSALFLYDAHEGGVGYSEKVFERMEKLLQLGREVLEGCQCGFGCPGCIPSLPPGLGLSNEDLESFFIESNVVRVMTQSLIKALLEGVVEVPEIKRIEKPYPFSLGQGEEDKELLKLTTRLERASRVLQKKRDRIY